MQDSFLKRTGTIDRDALAVTLRCVRGDDFETTVDVVKEWPNPYVPGEILTDRLDADTWVWDSLIYEVESGEPVAAFDIDDHPSVMGRVLLRLGRFDTMQLDPGTYGYWVHAAFTDSGEVRTFLRGKFEVTLKPE